MSGAKSLSAGCGACEIARATFALQTREMTLESDARLLQHMGSCANHLRFV